MDRVCEYQEESNHSHQRQKLDSMNDVDTDSNNVILPVKDGPRVDNTTNGNNSSPKDSTAVDVIMNEHSVMGGMPSCIPVANQSDRMDIDPYDTVRKVVFHDKLSMELTSSVEGATTSETTNEHMNPKQADQLINDDHFLESKTHHVANGSDRLSSHGTDPVAGGLVTTAHVHIKSQDREDHPNMINDRYRKRRRKLRLILRRQQQYFATKNKSVGSAYHDHDASKRITLPPPSFVRLLLMDWDQDGDDKNEGIDQDMVVWDGVGNNNAGEEHPRKQIRFDLDVELGLKERPSPEPSQIISMYPISRIAHTTAAVPLTGIVSNSQSLVEIQKQPLMLAPLDEGWYEGVVSPMALVPDDALYLTPLQQWIRQQLELFSATDRDVTGSQAGRRSPVVRGKVGVRCRHCAAALLSPASLSTLSSAAGAGAHSQFKEAVGSEPATGQKLEAISTAAKATDTKTSPGIPPDRIVWPPGSVSYPANISGLYPVCSQKPALHFQQHCPYIPASIKATLIHLQQDMALAQQQQLQGIVTVNTGSNETEHFASIARTRRSEGGISAALYYHISAKRIGLVEVTDGMRFGRDLTLDPLPMDTIRVQVEREMQEQQQQQQQQQHQVASAAEWGSSKLPSVVNTSSMASSSVIVAGVGDNFSSSNIIVADPVSERVLAEAVAQPDNPQHRLARRTDKAMLTDYIYLLICQLGICHTVPADFHSRGKKPKLMRIGLTGFCCRYCQNAISTNQAGVRNPSAAEQAFRSFPSAPENLSSAISTAFALHLNKCIYTPANIKNALTAYKRLHSRQMAHQIYGAQRRLFQEIWQRLRSADRTEAEIEITEPEKQQLESDRGVHASGAATSEILTAGLQVNSEYSRPVPSFLPDVYQEGEDAQVIENSVGSDGLLRLRPPGFPTCDDAETQAVLTHALTIWDAAKENDNLIVRADLSLVTDYVFLAMRQMRAAFWDEQSDRSRLRRSCGSGVAGLCCRHCHALQEENAKQQQVSPSIMLLMPSPIPAGRSFPSAPDNIASTLNTSMFNHMQQCSAVPQDLKRALAKTRLLHSDQRAYLAFGAQRRYFRILFQRLQDATTKPVAAPTDSPKKGEREVGIGRGEMHCEASVLDTTRLDFKHVPNENDMTDNVVKTQAKPVASACFMYNTDHEMQRLGYVRFGHDPSTVAKIITCRHCRMVPMQFRTPGSMFLSNHDWKRTIAEQHHITCHKESLCLDAVARAGMEAIELSFPNRQDVVDLAAFEALVDVAVGGQELFVKTLIARISSLIRRQGQDEKLVECTLTWRDLCVIPDVSFSEVAQLFEDLAQEQDCELSNLMDHSTFLTFLLLISPNLVVPDESIERKG